MVGSSVSKIGHERNIVNTTVVHLATLCKPYPCHRIVSSIHSSRPNSTPSSILPSNQCAWSYAFSRSMSRV